MNSPWKKRRKIPDPQVRDVADQFDDARLLLDAQPPGSGLLLPLLNNAVVALELYFKSLGAVAIYTPCPGFPGRSIVTAEAEVKGHGLIDLLESIPDGVRQSLERAYAARHTGTECCETSSSSTKGSSSLPATFLRRARVWTSIRSRP